MRKVAGQRSNVRPHDHEWTVSTTLGVREYVTSNLVLSEEKVESMKIFSNWEPERVWEAWYKGAPIKQYDVEAKRCYESTISRQSDGSYNMVWNVAGCIAGDFVRMYWDHANHRLCFQVYKDSLE